MSLVRSLVGLLRAQNNPRHSARGLTVWLQRPIMDIERGAAESPYRSALTNYLM